MKTLIAYLLLVYGTSFSGTVFAQAADSIKPWSIADCFRYATEHNIEISTLRLDELSSMQDLSAAKAARIPGVSGSVTNLFNHANNNVNGELVPQLTTSGTYSVNSSLVLWNDNYIRNNIRQKELQTISAGLSVQQSLNNITLLITRSYLDILLAKENLKYIADLVSTSEARVKQGQMFYDAGSIAKKDLLQLQAQLASDKYLLVQIQNAIRQNLLSLKQTLQLPIDTPFDITTPDTVIISTSLIPLHYVRSAALRNFPEIRIGQVGMDIAKLDIAKVRAGFRPALSLNGALSTGYNDVLTNSVNLKTGYFTQVKNDFYQRVGFTLSIPIYSNRVNKTNQEKARIAYKIAASRLENEELVLSQAVEQAYLNASNAVQSYAAAEQQLLAARESYRIANEQFKLVGMNLYDLLQLRNQYVQAVQAYTQARYGAVLQQKIYEFYMGRAVTL